MSRVKFCTYGQIKVYLQGMSSCQQSVQTTLICFYTSVPIPFLTFDLTLA